MELTNAKLTFLVGQEGTIIEIHDSTSGVTFLRAELTPEQLSSALSRLSRTDIHKLELYSLDIVGKKLETDKLAFEIPSELRGSRYADQLHEIALTKLSDGWMPDKYYASQNSFYTDSEGRDFARVNIRRYV